MAKDNRMIHQGVTIAGTTYTDGMEDELAEAMTETQVKYLSDQGAISGDWKVKKAVAVKEPAQTDKAPAEKDK